VTDEPPTLAERIRDGRYPASRLADEVAALERRVEDLECERGELIIAVGALVTERDVALNELAEARAAAEKWRKL